MAELGQTSFFSDANLIAYWKLEDVNDSKGSNTLTNNGSISFSAAKYNNGGDLGASNSTKYFNVNSNLGLNGNSDATIAFWLKLQTEISSGSYKLITHTSQTGADRYLDVDYQYNSGTRRIELNIAGAVTDYNTTLGTTNFIHIAVTRNVSGNVSKLYINGANVASGTVGSTTGGANKFAIGADVFGNSKVSGIYDDYAVFSRALSDTEINNLYVGLPTGGSFLLNFI